MQRTNLTEGSIRRGLFLFMVPMLVGNVLQSLNGSINAVWVGRYLGEAALTATSNANVVMFLLLGSVMGLSMAATILVGQNIGAKRLHEAKKVVGSSATFFFAIACVLALIGWALADRLLRGMSTPETAMPLAIAYIRMIFLAMPVMYTFAFVMSVLRGAGDAKTPFYYLLMSVVLDIALNPMLIFGFGPVPALGITGSGLATVIAQSLSLTGLLVHLYRHHHPLCLKGEDAKLLRPDGAIIGALVRKGVPMGLQMIVLSLSAVLMITLVNRFGVDTAAAFGAAQQLWSYIQMPAFALSMAVSTMAAQNVGAQKWGRVKSIARNGVLFNFILTGSLVLIIELFSSHALGVFLPAGSAALPIAEHLNRVAAWSFVFFGVSMVLGGAVRATGAVIVPLLVLTFSLLVVRFPLAQLMIPRWQANAIWWSFPVSAVLSAILMGIYYKIGGWRTARMMPAHAGAPGAAGAPIIAPASAASQPES